MAPLYLITEFGLRYNAVFNKTILSSRLLDLYRYTIIYFYNLPFGTIYAIMQSKCQLAWERRALSSQAVNPTRDEMHRHSNGMARPS